MKKSNKSIIPVHVPGINFLNTVPVCIYKVFLFRLYVHPYGTTCTVHECTCHVPPTRHVHTMQIRSDKIVFQEIANKSERTN